MVESVDFLSQTIINYLGEERLALLCAYTDIFPDEKLSDGVLWAQLCENELSSVVALGEKGKALVFTSEKTDFTELSFILPDRISSPDKLPFDVIDEKYLMNAVSAFDENEKSVETEHFVKIKTLETADTTAALEKIAPKIYRARKGVCRAAEISENEETVSGGFITDCESFGVITDVFTKESHRNKGCGTALVKKLLKMSDKKKAYLLCEEKNLDFYKKIGFEIVNTVYEYRRERS